MAKGTKGTKKSTKSVKRGRPLLYQGAQKKHIVGKIREYGLTGAMNILQADKDASPGDFEGTKAECQDAAASERSLAKLRSLKLVPDSLTISMLTLAKFAAEAKITLQRGRPKAA